MRALPPKYLALPAQAIPCFVNEIAPVKSDSISDDDTQSVDSDCDDDTGLRGEESHPFCLPISTFVSSLPLFLIITQVITLLLLLKLLRT